MAEHFPACEVCGAGSDVEHIEGRVYDNGEQFWAISHLCLWHAMALNSIRGYDPYSSETIFEIMALRLSPTSLSFQPALLN